MKVERVITLTIHTPRPQRCGGIGRSSPLPRADRRRHSPREFADVMQRRVRALYREALRSNEAEFAEPVATAGENPPRLRLPRW